MKVKPDAATQVAYAFSGKSLAVGDRSGSTVWRNKGLKPAGLQNASAT